MQVAVIIASMLYVQARATAKASSAPGVYALCTGKDGSESPQRSRLLDVYTHTYYLLNRLSVPVAISYPHKCRAGDFRCRLCLRM